MAAACAVVLTGLLAPGPAGAAAPAPPKPPASAATFFIRGGGDGHGIGMSQYGAYGYALHGKDYRFILAHYYQHTTLGSTDPNQTVRVLLATGSAAFAGATKAGTKRLKPGTTYTVRPNADGSLTLINQAGKTGGHFQAPLTVTGPGPLITAGGGLYRGALEFRPDGAGGVETVEAVGLDDYVRGVISAEVPASWSPEALKAQAVAARTYAITTDVGGGSFDLYPDTRSQMYRGVSAETPQTDAAVAGTRGQVVTYNGVPVVTYFFNSSGGHTENIENVWQGATGRPWLRGVPDPYDAAGGDPYHRWGYDLAMTDAQSRLGSLVKGSLVGIRVTRHGTSPRILTAAVVGTKGSTSVSGVELQHVFGLLTTYAAFSTISTTATTAGAASAEPPASGSSHSATTPAPEGASAVAALVPLVRELTGSIPALSGRVFPGRQGDPLTIQALRNGNWHAVVHARLGAGGAYTAKVPGPGMYRVLYGGLDGPVVTVH